MLTEFPHPEFYLRLAELHGHYCPMSTLGVRLGWAAYRRLEGDVCSVEYLIQTCAVDGIRLVLDVEPLRVDPQELHRLNLSDVRNCWTIELLPEALELASTYRLLSSDTEREALLDQLRQAPEDSLLQITRQQVRQ